MAKKDDKGKDKPSKGKPPEEQKRKGHPFLFGMVVGLLIGLVLGWWFRPPESFPMDELKRATESKVKNATTESREKLADWVEQMADSLRQE